jgi:hypothetical protein
VAQEIEEILTPESGRILRQAREARGLSVAEASTRLRTNYHFIEAMESGDLDLLPPGPYRKAFLSEYAKFLNIKLESLRFAQTEEKDGIISSAVSAMPGVARKVTQSAVKTTESVVKKVEEGMKDAVEEITARDLWQEADQVRKERLGITSRKAEEPRMAIRKKEERSSDILPPEEPSTGDELPPPKPVRRMRRFEAEKNIPGEELSEVYEPDAVEDEIRPGMSRATKTIIGLLIVIAAVVGYSIITKKTTQPTAVIEPEQKTSVKPPEQKIKPVIPSKKDSASVIAPPNDSLIFTITAKENVWVSISPDVGKGFRGDLAKGEIKRFPAKEKYVVFLGNQKAVLMTLDGKPLSNLPTIPGSNIVVRDAIITRDKISIGQAEQNNAQKQEPEASPKKQATNLPPDKTNKTPAKNLPIKKQIRSIKPVLPQ